MKKILTGLLLFFFVAPIFAGAQTGEIYIHDIQTDKENYSVGEEVDGNFTLSNVSAERQSDIYYTIRSGQYVGGEVVNPLGKSERFGPFYAESNSSQDVSFSYTLPSALTGEVGLDIEASLLDGTVVGWGTVKLDVSGTPSQKVLDAISVKVNVNGNSFTANEGVIVMEGDTVFLDMMFIDNTSRALSPKIELFDRFVGGELVHTFSSGSFITGKDVVTERSIQLPEFLEAGVYAGKLTLESNGVEYGSAEFRYVIDGQIGTINNINVSNLSPAADEDIVVTVQYSGTPFTYNIASVAELIETGTITVTFKNENGEVVYNGVRSVDLNKVPEELSFSGKTLVAAKQLSVSAELQDSEGRVLDAYNSKYPDEQFVQYQSNVKKDDSGFSLSNQILLYVVIAIVLLLILIKVVRTKKGNSVGTVVVVLFLFGSLFTTVSAATHLFIDTVSDEVTIFASINTFNSPLPSEIKTYAPGEEYAVEYSATYGSALTEPRSIETYYLEPTNPNYTNNETFLQAQDADWWRQNALQIHAKSDGGIPDSYSLVFDESFSYYTQVGHTLARDYFNGDKTISDSFSYSGVMAEYTNVLQTIANETASDLSRQIDWGSFSPIYAPFNNQVVTEENFNRFTDHVGIITNPIVVNDSRLEQVYASLYQQITNAGCTNVETPWACTYEANYNGQPSAETRNLVAFNIMLDIARGMVVDKSDALFLVDWSDLSRETSSRVRYPGFTAPSVDGTYNVYLYSQQETTINGTDYISRTLASKDICVSESGDCVPDPDLQERACSGPVEDLITGKPVRFTAQTILQGDPDKTYDYVWSGDVTGEGIQVQTVFEQAGNYSVTVTGTNTEDPNEVLTSSCDVIVSDGLAVSCVPNLEESVYPGPIFLRADVTNAKGDVTYEWQNYGSGSTGETTSYTPVTTGLHESRVVVTDTDGSQASDICSVEVVGDEPEQEVQGVSCNKHSGAAIHGLPVTIFAQPHIRNTGSVLEYEWSSDDPNEQFTTVDDKPYLVRHTFASPGQHIARVVMIDRTNNEEYVGECNIDVVEELAVRCDPVPSEDVTPGTEVEWISTVYNGVGDVSYLWSGDNQGGTESSSLFVPPAPGQYGARVDITDSSGQTAIRGCGLYVIPGDTPVDPGDPSGPSTPGDATDPSDPSTPGDPGPSDPASPSDPSTSGDPSDPGIDFTSGDISEL